jgi:hypothetical protein
MLGIRKTLGSVALAAIFIILAVVATYFYSAGENEQEAIKSGVSQKIADGFKKLLTDNSDKVAEGLMAGQESEIAGAQALEALADEAKNRFQVDIEKTESGRDLVLTTASGREYRLSLPSIGD